MSPDNLIPNSTTASIAAEQMSSARSLQLHYQVAMPQPTNHLFEVTLQLQGWSQPALDLKMPAWTPGSYLVREYARHLQNFSAHDDRGQPLAWQKVAKNHWRIENGTTDRITVRYQIFANELTVRTNHLDGTHGYFNGAAIFFYVPNYQQQPIEVTIVPPHPDWNIATALPAKPGSSNTFWAKDFDTLVDSPFEIGLHTRLEQEILGKPHAWVIWGKGNLEVDRLLADTQKIVETEAAMFGGLPYDRYLFLLHLTNGYGGLEHKDSCSLIYDRRGFRKPEQYERFIQLVAHEFFHLWNVKRIRPKALEVFDYEGENYTPSLWFCEGVTSFYDLLIPLRAGIYGAKSYLKHLGQEISRYLTTPGRKVQPLSESSFDAWIKLYRPDANSPNAQMSYYLKGALVTLLLDLRIRTAHNHAKSFDDVLRILWEQFGQEEIGFTPEQLKATIEAVAGQDLTEFFDRYIDGLEELPLESALAEFGVELRSNVAEVPPYLGLRAAVENNRTIVKFVASGSPAQVAGIDAGDELLAIDGLRVNGEQLTDRLQQAQPGDRLDITFFHQDELQQTQVILAEPQPTQFTLVPVENPSESQAQHFASWLGTPITDVK